MCICSSLNYFTNHFIKFKNLYFFLILSIFRNLSGWFICIAFWRWLSLVYSSQLFIFCYFLLIQSYMQLFLGISFYIKQCDLSFKTILQRPVLLDCWALIVFCQHRNTCWLLKLIESMANVSVVLFCCCCCCFVESPFFIFTIINISVF